MPDQPAMGETPDPSIGSDIEELARRLGGVEHLDPKARATLAGLLRKLAMELDQAEPSAQKEHLAESAAQLVRAVQDQHEPGLIAVARERLETAVARAEAKAPVATDLVLQVIDTLARSGNLIRARAQSDFRSILHRFPHQLWLLGRAEADVRLRIKAQFVARKLQAERHDERRLVEADLRLEGIVGSPCPADGRWLLG